MEMRNEWEAIMINPGDKIRDIDYEHWNGERIGKIQCGSYSDLWSILHFALDFLTRFDL